MLCKKLTKYEIPDQVGDDGGVMPGSDGSAMPGSEFVMPGSEFVMPGSDRASPGLNASVENAVKFFSSLCVSGVFFDTLSIKNLGRKYSKKAKKDLVIEKNFVTLQSQNWSKKHPTS